MTHRGCRRCGRSALSLLGPSPVRTCSPRSMRTPCHVWMRRPIYCDWGPANSVLAVRILRAGTSATRIPSARRERTLQPPRRRPPYRSRWGRRCRRARRRHPSPGSTRTRPRRRWLDRRASPTPIARWHRSTRRTSSRSMATVASFTYCMGTGWWFSRAGRPRRPRSSVKWYSTRPSMGAPMRCSSRTDMWRYSLPCATAPCCGVGPGIAPTQPLLRSRADATTATTMTAASRS